MTGPDQSACLITDGYLAAANFAGNRRMCGFARARSEEIVVYAGATVVANGDTVRYDVPLNSESACLLAGTHSLCANGDVSADTAPDGGIYVTNTGPDRQVVGISGGADADQQRSIDARQTIRI